MVTIKDGITGGVLENLKSLRNGMEIKPEHFSSLSMLNIWNMNNAAAQGAGGYKGSFVGDEIYSLSTLALGADVLGLSRATAFDGTNDVCTTTLPSTRLVTADNVSFSAEVYRASWAAPGATTVIASDITLNASGAYNNGWVFQQLVTSGNLSFATYSAGTKTSEVTYDITGLAAGYHQLGFIREAGVTQKLYVDGALVATATDDTDGIGAHAGFVTKGDATTQWDVTKTGNTMKFLWDDTGTDPSITTTTVKVRDQVTISGSANPLNDGSFVVTGVGSKYFEVYNRRGVAGENQTALTIKFKPVSAFSLGGTAAKTALFTGRLDEICLQKGAIWAANDFRLLYEVPRTNDALVVRDGSVTTGITKEYAEATYADVPRTAATAPGAAVPKYAGEIFVDTTAKKAYIATTATGDWAEISEV